MLLFLLSLAGIPPAAGFLGKYYIFLSLIESRHYWLASAGVLYALFGLYYYLRIANAMFMRDADGNGAAARQPRHAVRARRDGAGDDRDRSLPEPFIRTRELVAGNRAVAARGGDDEVKSAESYFPPSGALSFD